MIIFSEVSFLTVSAHWLKTKKGKCREIQSNIFLSEFTAQRYSKIVLNYCYYTKTTRVYEIYSDASLRYIPKTPQKLFSFGTSGTKKKNDKFHTSSSIKVVNFIEIPLYPCLKLTNLFSSFLPAKPNLSYMFPAIFDPLMTHSEFEEIKTLLSSRKNIAIVTHKNPDGDAVGSSLGLYNYLFRKQHRVRVIVPNEYPSFLQWLPGNNKVVEYSKNPIQAQALIKKADIIFCLDFNALRRIDELGKLVKKSKGIKILIDHHLQPERFANYMMVEKKSCSTAQLVFDFIVAMGDKKLINKKVANCLYTGIMTDSLNFKVTTTSAHTHRIVADLIEAGAQNNLAYSLVYDTNTENRIRLLGHCLAKEMKVLKEYNASFIALSASDLKKFDFQKGDTEGVVNYPLSIKGIIFSALFMEMKNEIKISFRSKGNFDVNKFARKHFNGGGHLNAAGGEAHTTLDEAVTKFVNLLPEYREELLK